MLINKFDGEYAFLSNFYEAPVTFDGLTYLNNEAAFQAQKTLDQNIRKSFTTLNPSEAKRKGRRLLLGPDWEDIKYDIMYRICKAKFDQNDDLAKRLIATGKSYLEEGNTWGDKIWGTVNGVGENNLGKILMRVRSDISDDCGAMWIRVENYFACSKCGMSALNDYRGRSTDSRFCPTCGKMMLNSTMPDIDSE